MSTTEATVATVPEEVKVVETPAAEPAPVTEAPIAEPSAPATEQAAPATVRFFAVPLTTSHFFFCRRHPRKKSPKLL